MSAAPSQSSASMRPAQAAYRSHEAMFAFGALTAEIVLLWAASTGRMSHPVALGWHLAVVAILLAVVVVRRRAGQDSAAALLLAFTVLIVGPFGAVGNLLIGWLSRQGADDRERLEHWYERIAFSTETSPMSRMSDHIMTGRAMDLDLAPPLPFTDLIENGSIGEKQSILGLIARQFHPDYLPALQLALVSNEPVIRVQAAAVAAKVRGEMPALVDKLLLDAADSALPPDDVLRRVREARLCVTSGLMEDKDSQKADRLVDGLLARTVARLERNPPASASDNAANIVSANEAATLYETHLLSQRRYTEFRRFRRKQKWARRGPWQWRPLSRGPKLSVTANGTTSAAPMDAPR